MFCCFWYWWDVLVSIFNAKGTCKIPDHVQKNIILSEQELNMSCYWDLHILNVPPTTPLTFHSIVFSFLLARYTEFISLMLLDFLAFLFGDIFTTSLTVSHILCEVQLVMYLCWCTLHFIGTITLKPQYNNLSARSLAFVDDVFWQPFYVYFFNTIQILRLLHWSMHCSWKNEYRYLSTICDLWMFYSG